jgi:hypothetical protein
MGHYFYGLCGFYELGVIHITYLGIKHLNKKNPLIINELGILTFIFRNSSIN